VNQPTVPGSTPGAPEFPVSTSLRHPLSLAALYRLLWDHAMVHALASTYPTWGHLSAASPADLGYVAGRRGAALSIPAVPPVGPEIPDGVELLTRYSPRYPADLREVADPPVVLYLRGRLPDGPTVTIGGAHHPSPQGIEIARSAALAAVAQRVPVVALLTDGAGEVALRTAAAAGGRCVAVLPHGLDQVSRHTGLLQRVLEAGGAWLTEVPPGVSSFERFVISGARIAAALSPAVVLAEVGRHPSSGAPLATAAVAAGRYLIVPSPQQHYVPESALGLRVLTQTRSFSPSWYGTSPRLDARILNGLSPADAVVSNQQQIADAIAVACRVRPYPQSPAGPPVERSPSRIR
jgi:DNA processing protein